MSLSKSIRKFRFYQKLKREKPHFWHISSTNAGYIQNYKVGTRSLRLVIAQHILQSQGTIINSSQISKATMQELDKKHSGFYSPETIRQKWPDLFIFCFVRNPLDRLYSCYTDKVIDAKREGRPIPFYAYDITFETSFSEFVRIVADTPDTLSERHFRSQHCSLSINGSLITNFIGRLESFSEDWQTLRDQFSFPELSHKNKSSKSKASFRDHYSKETYQLAIDRYAKDIQMLGYENDV